MRRVIGMDIHRTFAEVVFWEDGRLRWHGRVDMTRSGLEGFGRREQPVDVLAGSTTELKLTLPFLPYAETLTVTGASMPLWQPRACTGS